MLVPLSRWKGRYFLFDKKYIWYGVTFPKIHWMVAEYCFFNGTSNVCRNRNFPEGLMIFQVCSNLLILNLCLNEGWVQGFSWSYMFLTYGFPSKNRLWFGMKPSFLSKSLSFINVQINCLNGHLKYIKLMKPWLSNYASKQMYHFTFTTFQKVLQHTMHKHKSQVKVN